MWWPIETDNSLKNYILKLLPPEDPLKTYRGMLLRFVWISCCEGLLISIYIWLQDEGWSEVEDTKCHTFCRAYSCCMSCHLVYDSLEVCEVYKPRSPCKMICKSKIWGILRLPNLYSICNKFLVFLHIGKMNLTILNIVHFSG